MQREGIYLRVLPFGPLSRCPRVNSLDHMRNPVTNSTWLMIVAAVGLLALTNGCLLFVAGAAAGAGVGTYA